MSRTQEMRPLWRRVRLLGPPGIPPDLDVARVSPWVVGWRSFTASITGAALTAAGLSGIYEWVQTGLTENECWDFVPCITLPSGLSSFVSGIIIFGWFLAGLLILSWVRAAFKLSKARGRKLVELFERPRFELAIGGVGYGAPRRLPEFQYEPWIPDDALLFHADFRITNKEDRPLELVYRLKVFLSESADNFFWLGGGWRDDFHILNRPSDQPDIIDPAALRERWLSSPAKVPPVSTIKGRLAFFDVFAEQLDRKADIERLKLELELRDYQSGLRWEVPLTTGSVYSVDVMDDYLIASDPKQ